MAPSTVRTVLLIVVILLSAGILSLHILAALTSGGRRRGLSYVAILLHLPLYPSLIFLGASLETCILATLVSVFVYTLLEYIRYLRHTRSERGGQNDL